MEEELRKKVFRFGGRLFFQVGFMGGGGMLAENYFSNFFGVGGTEYNKIFVQVFWEGGTCIMWLVVMLFL